ncbi:MAG TPA: hypothetical protein VGE10_10990 [Zeimonas sp.]
MNAKHTAGPWVVDSGEALNVRAPHGGIVAQLHHLKGRHGMGGRLPDGEAVANAHLIAAAHDLLDFARALSQGLRMGYAADELLRDGGSLRARLEDAIAKATATRT